MPTNNKKYLDQEGVKFLWSKISMEDYPNNETLIAVLNAIDETKADKNWVNDNFISHSKQNLTNEQQKQARENIGLIEETSDDALELLNELGVIESVTDEEGFVLTDENNNILTI